VFHGIFEDGFRRIEQIDLSLCYLQGLLSGLNRKTIELIALKFRSANNVRNLQRFMGEYKWDEEYIGNKHKEEVSKALLVEGGVLSVDSSEIAKKGKESVGVSRQYCGRLGKVENCQSGVYVGYASVKGHALIERKLFMPKKWFTEEYGERRTKCKVPKELVFKKKTELASEMIGEIQKSGFFPCRWITCDTIFGNSPDFLKKLPSDIYYLADIPNDKSVYIKTKSNSASKAGVKVSEIAKEEKTEWKYTKLAEGSKGPVFGYVARVRVLIEENNDKKNERWLFLRKISNTGELKYCISNAPEETGIEEMVHVSTMRWPIERSFQEGKSELGMADYEHRSWQAWHRHMTYVFLAQLFLLRISHMLKKNTSSDVATNT
jgi:SRSO17 transposase